MRAVLSVLLLLTTTPGFASVDAIIPIEPYSVERELIAEFLRATWKRTPSVEQWNDIEARLRTALETKMKREKSRATYYPLMPFKQTIQKRVDQLADRCAEIITDTQLTADQRAERFIDVLAKLTLALGKNTGGPASYRVPLLAASVSMVELTSIVYMTADRLEYTLASLAAAAVPASAAIFVKSKPASIATRSDLAAELAEGFWRRVAFNLAESSPDHSIDQVTEALDRRLSTDDATWARACESWLAKNKGGRFALPVLPRLVAS